MPGFLFAPTVIMLFLALEWGGTKYAWKSATVIGLFCGSFGNLLLFLAWKHRVGAEAMIPLHLLKNRIVWSSCLNMGLFYRLRVHDGLLLSHIFPGCEGCVAHCKWCGFPSTNPDANGDHHRRWRIRYAHIILPKI